MNKNELTTTEKNTAEATSGFMMLGNMSFDDAMSDELNGLSGGFERIKIPSAGSTMFEIPGDDPDEPDAVREFSAVILYHHPLHSLYHDKYVGGNNPPDCGSFDGITGEGNPGGQCATCPYNQFGSGENGAKACKNRRRVYVLREGEMFPMLLSLPTGSLKEFSRYVKRLLTKGRKTNSVVTKFALKKAVNAGGIAYSQATFTLDRPLTDAEYALIAPMAGQMKQHSRRMGYEQETAYDVPPESAYHINPETGEIE